MPFLMISNKIFVVLYEDQYETMLSYHNCYPDDSHFLEKQLNYIVKKIKKVFENFKYNMETSQSFRNMVYQNQSKMYSFKYIAEFHYPCNCIFVIIFVTINCHN